MFELQVKDGQFVATEAVKIALSDYRDGKLTIEEIKDDMAMLDNAVMKAMKDNNIKSCQIEDADGHIHTFTVKAASVRVTADTKKMKDDGIFDEYSKQTNVKESLLHSES